MVKSPISLEFRRFLGLGGLVVVLLASCPVLADGPPSVVWDDTLGVNVEAVAWSPDGATIAVGGQSSPSQPIELRDAATGAWFGDLPSQPLGTFSLAYSPDGAYLAAGGAVITSPDVPSGIGDVFELASSTSIASYAGSQVAFSQTGNRLATAGYGITRGVLIHNVPAGDLVLDALDSDAYASVALSPDGATLAVGTFDGTVLVVSVASGNVIDTLDYDDPATAYVTNVKFSPDGTMLAAAGVRLGGVLVSPKIWRTSDYMLMHTLSPSGLGFGDIEFTPDSAVLVGATSKADLTRELRFWQVGDGQLLETLTPSGFVADLAFSPDGAQFAYGQAGGYLAVARNPLATIPYDLDNDGDVDLDDYALFADCLTGPGGLAAPECQPADADQDDDIDLFDYANWPG